MGCHVPIKLLSCLVTIFWNVDLPAKTESVYFKCQPYQIHLMKACNLTSPSSDSRLSFSSWPSNNKLPFGADNERSSRFTTAKSPARVKMLMNLLHNSATSSSHTKWVAQFTSAISYFEISLVSMCHKSRAAKNRKKCGFDWSNQGRWLRV